MSTISTQRNDGIYQEITLFVDSRDCAHNGNFWNQFTVDLNETEVGTLQNVTQVEILALSYPRIQGEDYVVMNMPELGSNIYTSTKGMYHVSDVFFFDNYNLPAGQIKPIKGQDFVKKVHTLTPAIPQLTRLSFQFKKHEGDISLYDFNASNVTDVPPVTVLLKLTMVQKHYN